MGKPVHCARRGVVAVALAALFAGTTGCWTSTRHVLVETDPPGATLFVNGRKQGVTPRKIEMPFHESDRVFVQAVSTGRVPAESWYTLETVPDDGHIMIRLTRD